LSNDKIVFPVVRYIQEVAATSKILHDNLQSDNLQSTYQGIRA